MTCCCKNPNCKTNVLLARQAKEISSLKTRLEAERRRTNNGVPMPKVNTQGQNLPWDWSQPPQ